jgi:hypothetical protein
MLILRNRKTDWFPADAVSGPLRRLPRAEVDLLRRWQQSLAALWRSAHPDPRVCLDADALAAVARARRVMTDDEFNAVMKSLN